MPKSNEAIFQEVNGAGLWFHAKKTRPIWVRLLEHEETVKTLEGEEQVPAGNYLCRGEAGDIWPQNKDRLAAKYTLTAEVDEQGWRKCDPKPDAAGVMAAQVPHAFQVQAKWASSPGNRATSSSRTTRTVTSTTRKMCGSSTRACLRRRTNGWLPIKG